MTKARRRGVLLASRRERGRFDAGRRRLVVLEPLEPRTLLAATLTIDAANGVSFVGSALSNDLSITLAGGTYTFSDPGEPIVVVNNGTAVVGSSGPDNVTVTGLTSIAVDLGAGDDRALVTASAHAAGVITAIRGGAGTDALVIDAEGLPVDVASGQITLDGLPPIAFDGFERVTVDHCHNHPPVVTAVDFTATRGVGLVDQVVATFTDANGNFTTAPYTATIDWGDGQSTAGTITADASDPTVFYVTGSYVYANSGKFPTSITVADRGGFSVNFFGGVEVIVIVDALSSTVTADGMAKVLDTRLAPVRFNDLAAVAGTPVVDAALVTFEDLGGAGAASRYVATIDWGDGTPPSAGRVKAAGGFLEVLGTHAYASAGGYSGQVLIRGLDGGELVMPFGASVTVPGIVFAELAPTEDVPLVNVVVGKLIDSPDLPVVPHLYAASIDWGDGTTSPAFIDPSNGAILGSHTYRESGAYLLRVAVATVDNPLVVVATTTVSVADVPVPLSGRLDPASDTGISDSDGITFIRQPVYFGATEAHARVELFATLLPGPGPLIPLGFVEADGQGAWQIRSQVALADGTYAVTALATDRNGVTTATAALGTLVVDTVGPRVVGLEFQRFQKRILTTFQDDRSGMARRTLIDGENYELRRPHTRLGQILIRTLSTTTPAAPTDPQEVTARITGVPQLRRGTYVYTVVSGPYGVTDVAGNPLDGEFYGRFPSGNGVPGRDFVAVYYTIDHTTPPPRPARSFASPEGSASSVEERPTRTIRRREARASLRGDHPRGPAAGRGRTG